AGIRNNKDSVIAIGAFPANSQPSDWYKHSISLNGQLPNGIKTFNLPTGYDIYIGGVNKSAQWDAGSGSGFSGDYNDLTNKPVLFDGQYSSLTGTPAIPEDYGNWRNYGLGSTAIPVGLLDTITRTGWYETNNATDLPAGSSGSTGYVMHVEAPNYG